MVCATRIVKDRRVKKTDRIQLEGIGYSRNCEEIRSMDDVHAFFKKAHAFNIAVWVNGYFIGYIPNLGKKISDDPRLNLDMDVYKYLYGWIR